MHAMKSKVLWLAGGVLMASLALSPVVLMAKPTMVKSIPPAVVATVDLEQIFNSLEEKATADKALQDYATTLQAEQDKIRQEITQINDELSVLAETSNAHQQKFAALQLKTLEYQAKVEHNKLQLEKRKGIVLRNIYMSIKAQVRAYAQAQGIDIVMLDDSIVDVELGDEQDVSKQISARRTLYCNPQLNITQDVIDLMNKK